jgi:phage-related protein
VKPAIFHPSARETIHSFPVEVRKELGKAIFDLQRGHILAVPLSRPMPSIALGVEELRIRDRAGIYRVSCYARLGRVGVSRVHKKDAKHAEERIGIGDRNG